MGEIHPTAVVSPEAELADDVEIGPYCIVGPHVSLGRKTRLMAHVFVDGWTSIGEECQFYPFASIGTRTQDLKFKGGAPRLQIGDRTTVRESVTINAATSDGDTTRVGSDCLLMAYAHVAHDCVVGDRVILANCGTLAGHVSVENQAIIGGLSAVHQFVRIGRLSIVGGCSKVTQDVPPFMMANGNPLEIRGTNALGLKRNNIEKPAQTALKRAHHILYRQDLSTRQALKKASTELPPEPEIQQLLTFIEQSERGITTVMLYGSTRRLYVLCLCVGMATLKGTTAKTQSAGSYVNFSFDQVEIRLLVSLVGEMTGKRFVIDDQVEGKVSIVTPSQLPVEEVYPIFLSVLESSGYSVLKKGGVHHIVSLPASEVLGAPVVGPTEETAQQGFVTKVLKIEHVNVLEVKKGS